ncbi:beta-lactamase hydrolase domain-containing protein [Fortiea contorta]|uniref:beta-lactamase hydrolase domain-containing protein n=1 Tax=Fortiea contorta TaxID=1892405 RepID=UPI0004768B72|nr:sulfur transferase domain-containing protein [Fortiea contorta]
MNPVRKINEQLAISGQIVPFQLQQIAEDGYKSVLNLRASDEQGWLDYEQEKTELLGLCYVNMPIKAEEINRQSTLLAFQAISELPKPILIHCDNSLRSAAIVLLYIATKQGITFENAWQQTINLGLF